MQYHAVSYALNPKVKKVTLVGYNGENVIEAITDNKKISIKPIPTFDLYFLSRISFARVILKGILLMFSILLTLVTVGSYELIVIQNPPCLPAVLSATAISVFNGSKIFLDWHNIGFMMFEKKSKILITLARSLEKIACKRASYHTCVSAAMQRWLREHFQVEARVLRDGPPPMFSNRPLSAQQKHELFTRTQKLVVDVEQVMHAGDWQVASATIQTVALSQTSYAMRTDADRSAVVVSSTSWSDDEDFGILLRALLLVETHLASTGHTVAAAGYFRSLAVVITGKGPNKEHFERSVEQHVARGELGRHVTVHTLWLSPGDYPLLIRAADLGVSLHTSTSGLDLPMKVYDMFGSGVPVCAIRFACVDELVRQNVNGLLFSEEDGVAEQELASQIIRLLIDPLHELRQDGQVIEVNDLSALRKGACEIASWDDNWQAVMPHLVSL